MRCLIAISSCWDFEKNGYNDVLRETWLPEVANVPNLDYQFFFGSGQGAELAQLQLDSVMLDQVEDDYGHVTYKTRANRKWALAHNYDYVFQCFPDTYCRPERLIACGFQEFDYYGDFRLETAGPDNYPSGGPGYFTSKRVNELISNAPILGVWRDDITPYAEDLWVGKILALRKDLGFKYFDDQRFINRGTVGEGPRRTNSIISTHLSCPDRYYPERMREKHREWLAS